MRSVLPSGRWLLLGSRVVALQRARPSGRTCTGAAVPSVFPPTHPPLSGAVDALGCPISITISSAGGDAVQCVLGAGELVSSRG